MHLHKIKTTPQSIIHILAITTITTNTVKKYINTATISWIYLSGSSTIVLFSVFIHLEIKLDTLVFWRKIKKKNSNIRFSMRKKIMVVMWRMWRIGVLMKIILCWIIWYLWRVLNMIIRIYVMRSNILMSYMIQEKKIEYKNKNN